MTKTKPPASVTHIFSGEQLTAREIGDRAALQRLSRDAYEIADRDPNAEAGDVLSQIVFHVRRGLQVESTDRSAWLSQLIHRYGTWLAQPSREDPELPNRVLPYAHIVSRDVQDRIAGYATTTTGGRPDMTLAGLIELKYALEIHGHHMYNTADQGETSEVLSHHGMLATEIAQRVNAVGATEIPLSTAGDGRQVLWVSRILDPNP